MYHVELIEAAVAAPSSHNTQPWLFRTHPDRIELFADRTRALPVNDPFDRELTISCGAALLNLRVAAAAEGHGTEVEYTDTADSDLLATVRLDEGPADASLAELVPGIERRFTTRDAFQDRQLSDTLRHRIDEVAASEGARVHFVEQSRDAVAGLVAEGDRRQFANPRWRRELASWMHPRRAGDGLATSPWVAPISRLVVRHFDLGDRVGEDDEELAEDAPLLAVITTPTDEVRDWLRVGQALERALLVAAMEGVQAGYLNQPCQLEQLRPRLGELIGAGGQPQQLIRMGHIGEPDHRAPRRPVADVLITKYES
jgi:hypothetical protein